MVETHAVRIEFWSEDRKEGENKENLEQKAERGLERCPELEQSFEEHAKPVETHEWSRFFAPLSKTDGLVGLEFRKMIIDCSGRVWRIIFRVLSSFH